MKTIYLLLGSLLLTTGFANAQTNKLSLLFAGDAMQHKSQIEDARRPDGRYDYSQYFKAVQQDIDQADISVVNLEVTLGGKPYTGYPMFSAPDEFAIALKEAGFNVFLTANNHAADRGKKGIERTIRVLDSLQIAHTGTFTDVIERNIYYPLMLSKNGIRIALLNYTYDTNGMPVKAPNIVNLIDTVSIRKDIEEAKLRGAELIIANMHWGHEYVLKHNKEQQRLANFLIDKGVRLVIGNHPHVVQPVDIRREGNSIRSVIVYSLGNFISGMRTVNTSGGMMVRIDISKKEGKIHIDSFDYSLVWTHKSVRNGQYSDFRLLRVADHENEEGKKVLGTAYNEMEAFSKAAVRAIESLWK